MRLLSQREKTFLRKLFNAYDIESIKYIILRNYDGLPDHIGNDLDVFIPKDQRKKARDILIKLAKDLAFPILKKWRLEYFEAFWIITGKSIPLHIDLYPGAFTWKGMCYLSDSDLCDNRKSYGQIYILSTEHEALSLCSTSLLWGGVFKDRYASRIKSLLSDTIVRERFDNLFQKTFQTEVPEWIYSGDKVHLSVLLPIIHRMRNGVFKNSFRKAPLRTLFSFAKYCLYEIKTLCRPPGICIAVIGPDGSGKSTLIEATIRELSPYFGSILTHHWRPSILPDLGVLLGRRDKRSLGESVADPHAMPAHAFLIGTLSLLYYLSDYWFGYLTRVWRPLSKNHLVIFDRYACDMWLDPKRFRISLPEWFLKYAVWLTPQPDLYILLTGDPELIHARKPETSPADVAECLYKMNQLLKVYRSRAVIIDSMQPRSAVLDEAKKSILDVIKRKSSM